VVVVVVGVVVCVCVCVRGGGIAGRWCEVGLFRPASPRSTRMVGSRGAEKLYSTKPGSLILRELASFYGATLIILLLYRF
jgi:hypothetical protein